MSETQHEYPRFLSPGGVSSMLETPVNFMRHRTRLLKHVLRLYTNVDLGFEGYTSLGLHHRLGSPSLHLACARTSSRARSHEDITSICTRKKVVVKQQRHPGENDEVDLFAPRSWSLYTAVLQTVMTSRCLHPGHHLDLTSPSCRSQTSLFESLVHSCASSINMSLHACTFPYLHTWGVFRNHHS